LLYLNPNPEARPITMLPRMRDVLKSAVARANVSTFRSAADAIEAAGAKNLDECIKALDAWQRLEAVDPAASVELLQWFESSPKARRALGLLT
jgi:hypothetical protein